jgi:hypothetical protein
LPEAFDYFSEGVAATASLAIYCQQCFCLAEELPASKMDAPAVVAPVHVLPVVICTCTCIVPSAKPGKSKSNRTATFTRSIIVHISDIALSEPSATSGQALAQLAHSLSDSAGTPHKSCSTT